MWLNTLQQTILSQIDLSVLPHVDATKGDRIQAILTLVFSLTGAIALLVITIAGFRYSISHGDPGLIAQSKNAIIYALVGLVISVFAIAIVNFVIRGVS